MPLFRRIGLHAAVPVKALEPQALSPAREVSGACVLNDGRSSGRGDTDGQGPGVVTGKTSVASCQHAVAAPAITCCECSEILVEGLDVDGDAESEP